MSSKPVKRLNVHEQYKLINSPGTQRALAKQFGIAVGTVCEIKKAKERVTVLFCCSATGEKLKPLVIHKSQRPRSFGHMPHSDLPVDYAWNSKAWMTTTIWQLWLEDLNDEMVKQNRKILLFIDNCPSHADSELSNVNLMFLPANTTSRLQPLDAGIIKCFKVIFSVNNFAQTFRF